MLANLGGRVGHSKGPSMNYAFDLAADENWISTIKEGERTTLNIDGIIGWSSSFLWGRCLVLHILRRPELSFESLQQVCTVLLSIPSMLDDGLLYEQDAVWLVRRYSFSLNATACQLLAQNQLNLTRQLACILSLQPS